MSRIPRNPKIKNIHQLVDAIGAWSHPFGGESLPRIHLWDGRVVEGAFYRGKREDDVFDIEIIVCDSRKLLGFVERLLRHRRWIVISTGYDDDLATVIWKIRRPQQGEEDRA